MSFDNIKLEKGLYTTGKSFTCALESLDPSENYKGTALEGLDAYERQLKRFDIKVSGENSDSISKFFATTDSAALFPEYISRAVLSGIEMNNTVDDIVATVTNIDALDYRSIRVANDNSDYELSCVNEGAVIPELQVSLDSSLTKLKKYGKMLSASYEAIKYQKLDLFTTVLKRIGQAISRQEFLAAIQVMGDKAAIKVNKIGEELSYKDFVNVFSAIYPYNMNTIVCSADLLKDIFDLPEFKDSNANMNFHSTGNLVTPLGAKIIAVPSEENFLYAFDKDFAIEKVQAGGVLTEFNKIIDRQLERAAISTITGFNVIYEDSICSLNV